MRKATTRQQLTHSCHNYIYIHILDRPYLSSSALRKFAAGSDKLPAAFGGEITCCVMSLASAPQSWTSHAASTLRSGFVAYMFTVFVVSAFASPTGQEDRPSPIDPIDFNIPAQPLGGALVAFGATSGLDVYYNSAFAEGRRSATVRGKLTPVLALRELLEGTGLVPQITGPSSVILVPASREVVVPRRPVVAASTRYVHYFAMIQARISDALCRNAGTSQEGNETLMRVWLTASGTIDQVEVIGAAADQGKYRSLVSAVHGLAVGTPPADMPQPVTLVVFPPSEARHDCRASDAFQKAD